MQRHPRPGAAWHMESSGDGGWQPRINAPQLLHSRTELLHVYAGLQKSSSRRLRQGATQSLRRALDVMMLSHDSMNRRASEEPKSARQATTSCAQGRSELWRCPGEHGI